MFLQEAKHHGQHADDDGEVCEQPGGAGRGADGRTCGREEEDRHAALQDVARVRIHIEIFFYFFTP